MSQILVNKASGDSTKKMPNRPVFTHVHPLLPLPPHLPCLFFRCFGRGRPGWRGGVPAKVPKGPATLKILRIPAKRIRGEIFNLVRRNSGSARCAASRRLFSMYNFLLFFFCLLSKSCFICLLIFCCTRSRCSLVYSCTVVLHPLLLFLCVFDVFVRREVLLSELQDVEIVDHPLFDVQFIDAIATKMSLQDW